MGYILQGLGAFALCAGIAGLLFYLWYCLDYVTEVRRELTEGLRDLRWEVATRRQIEELRLLLTQVTPAEVIKNVDKKDKSEQSADFGKCD